MAYNAKDTFAGVRNKTNMREYLARCKAVLDLYVLRKQPTAMFIAGPQIDKSGNRNLPHSIRPIHSTSPVYMSGLLKEWMVSSLRT